MKDLTYIQEVNTHFEEWMASVGYEGQVWEDRYLKPLDKYEYPQKGVTYDQAHDLAEFISAIAAGTATVALLTGQAHVWVNYASDGGSRYAPIEAFKTFSVENHGELHEFQIFLASVGLKGPELLSAKHVLGMLRNAPESVVMSILSGHGSSVQSMLSYAPAGTAAVKVFRDAWDAAIRSPND